MLRYFFTPRLNLMDMLVVYTLCATLPWWAAILVAIAWCPFSVRMERGL